MVLRVRSTLVRRRLLSEAPFSNRAPAQGLQSEQVPLAGLKLLVGVLLQTPSAAVAYASGALHLQHAARNKEGFSVIVFVPMNLKSARLFSVD